MKWLKKIVAWVAKKLSKDQKAKLFDAAVDKWANEPKEVIPPKAPFRESQFTDHGPSDRIEKRKATSNKKGK